ncbi:hypothetical protein FEM33_14195 [Dyadobacter flavalbus]|uniref:Uncharacterized protein n=1 Tax=Dyadobacter flavalbus TaxID=2579942 RepID=A0A5M8QXJ8_9BACT|nr:DUF5908 family protein [Dyadobacter flavalbus]KAA6439406.1 hypothetical protein FEM33_14195 [Dyadobacter flavalbus]
MPIEIRELIIRATVDNHTGNKNTNAPELAAQNGLDSRQEDRIVARCMEQVMEYLRMQSER